MMAADKAEQAVNVEQWQAINERDGHFDGQFYYADRNTQLYCKPSCPTQIPKFNHVCIFSSGAGCRAQGFVLAANAGRTGRPLRIWNGPVKLNASSTTIIQTR